MNKIEVEILGLSSSPSAGGAYALLLKEVFGQRRLPIIIGAFEAQAIALELEGIKPPRPLTHDLLISVIENLGATLKEVMIDELKDNTFHAKISMEVSSLETIIDSRPSDAIALAVRTGAPIYVSDTVMNTAGFIPSSEEHEKKSDEAHEETSSQEPQPKETQTASLHDQLREAIEKEDYERAAKIRDEIKKREGSHN